MMHLFVFEFCEAKTSKHLHLNEAETIRPHNYAPIGKPCIDRFHKNKRIQKLLNGHGHRILWLPPYSPDLNPIEKKWAQAKFLRQGWIETTYLNCFMIFALGIIILF